MEEYLVSIVIPTKNRYSTLFELVRTLKKICDTYEELEVIIHDNSDDNSKAIKFFEKIYNNNIKYYYYKEWLSVGDNSDRAILASHGKYVCFIGDDDAVVEQIVQIAYLMKEFHIDSCGCDYSLYRWPQALSGDNNSFEYLESGKILREPDLKKELNYIFQNGIQSKKNLPGVYHGLVSRESLDLVYQKAGTFFPGPSPDMANSIALALFCKRHIMTCIPFVVDGYSKASTGHLTEMKKHIGKLENQDFLPRDTIENWTKEIPKIWLPNTIWPESAIQAVKKCGKGKYISKFNYTAMYIKIGIIYPECKKICKEYMKKYSNTYKKFITYVIVITSFLKHRIQRSKTLKYSFFKKEAIPIEEAIRVTRDIIEHRNYIYYFERALKSKKRRLQ